MITYLKVRNLAIVDEFAIEPGPGLNVLTGETGAGKSLLIDSLEFLSGARGSTEMIRSGTEKMSAEAIFHLPPQLGEHLDAIGVEVEPSAEGIEVIARREIGTNGRGRVLLNGSAVSVRDLAAAMDAVLEIHGQSESHQRVAGQSYRELLDEFAGNGALLDGTRATHDAWKTTFDQLRQLRNAQRDRALRLDLLRYQIDEIAATRLDPGEEEPLRSERNMLAHAQDMLAATAGAFTILEEDENSASTQLGRALHLLQPLAREIATVRTLVDDLQDVLYRLQEASRAISHLAGSVRHDPARLEEVEERLVTIDRLKKKYGGSVDAVLTHFQAIEDEYRRLTDYESNLDRLSKAEEGKFAEYVAAAEKLSTARKKAAHRFERAIQVELADLAMEGTTVRIVVSVGMPAASPAQRLAGGDHDDAGEAAGAPPKYGPHGYDRVEILVAPNRGEEPKPMQRIASGGELSRIQLAIAAALFKASKRAAAATLVFDEIDAGIGGRVAEVVGRKLHELAEKNQVICVTHLPQIASFGSTHFYVWKEAAGAQTRARIRRLDRDEERIDEIARMLGGATVAASAVAHARELVDAARSRR